MVQPASDSDHNIIDFATFRATRGKAGAGPIARMCRHCGAAMLDGESDDDCSSAGILLAGRPQRAFRAE